MEQYTCTDRIIKSGNRIVGYVLTSLRDNSQITVEPLELKSSIRHGNVTVDNLTLTSDDKLRLNLSKTLVHEPQLAAVSTGQQPPVKQLITKVARIALLDSGLLLDTLKFMGKSLIKFIFKL